MAGGRVLASDILLCVAFFSCYREMFPLRATPPSMQQLVQVGCTIFGAWMLISDANYLFLSLVDARGP
jgi:hypothetical protein